MILSESLISWNEWRGASEWLQEFESPALQLKEIKEKYNKIISHFGVEIKFDIIEDNDNAGMYIVSSNNQQISLPAGFMVDKSIPFSKRMDVSTGILYHEIGHLTNPNNKKELKLIQKYKDNKNVKSIFWTLIDEHIEYLMTELYPGLDKYFYTTKKYIWQEHKELFLNDPLVGIYYAIRYPEGDVRLNYYNESLEILSRTKFPDIQTEYILELAIELSSLVSAEEKQENSEKQSCNDKNKEEKKEGNKEENNCDVKKDNLAEDEEIKIEQIISTLLKEDSDVQKELMDAIEEQHFDSVGKVVFLDAEKLEGGKSEVVKTNNQIRRLKNALIEQSKLVIQKHGKLSKKKLWKSSFSDEIFYRKDLKEEVKFSLVMLIDTSYSMIAEEINDKIVTNYRKLNEAKEVMRQLYNGFISEELIDLYMYSFYSDAWELGDYCSSVIKRIYEHKNVKLDNPIKRITGLVGGLGTTRIGEVLRNLKKYLDKKNLCHKKVLFLITDGQPYAMGYTGQYAIDDSVNAIKEFENSGWYVVNIMIGNVVPLPVKRRVNVDDAKNLMNEVCSKLEDYIKKDYFLG